VKVGNQDFEDYFAAKASLFTPELCDLAIGRMAVVQEGKMIDTKTGKRALVINGIGRIFMQPFDDPFTIIDRELNACPLREAADAVVAIDHQRPTVGVPTPYHSTWLDNTKAKFLLGWRPEYDLKKMTDAAFDYRRSKDDPRIVWYPG